MDVKRWPRSTGRQQLIGEGEVGRLILQCLEARVIGLYWGASTKSRRKLDCGHSKEESLIKLQVLVSSSSGKPFRALPPQKTEALRLPTLNLQQSPIPNLYYSNI